MSSPKIRRLIFRLHAFFGLHVFSVLALLFLTGTMLVFIWEIQASFTSEMRLEEPAVSHGATPGQIYDATRGFAPDFRLANIHRSEASWIADRSFGRLPGRGPVNIWTHPDTGAVIGMTGAKDLSRFVRDFHTGFMTNHKIGGLMVTAFSFVLLIFIVTGLITYRRFWKGLLRAPPRHLGRRGWWGGLHRLIAVWLAPFLIIIALTGVFYMGDILGVLKGGLHPVRQAEVRASVIPESFDGAALERVTAAARRVVPDMHIIRIDMPFGARAGVTLFGSTDRLINLEHGNILIIDPVSFDVLGRFPRDELPTGNWANQINHNLHIGLWGGFASRLLWAGFGLGATLLCLSGAMVYASRVADGSDSRRRTVVGRIWQGMTLLKWGLVLFAVAVVGLTILRYAF